MEIAIRKQGDEVSINYAGSYSLFMGLMKMLAAEFDSSKKEAVTIPDIRSPPSIKEKPEPAAPVEQEPLIEQNAEANLDPAENLEKKSYSLPQLQAACAPLMDPENLLRITDILKALGANSLVELPKEKYTAFAEKIRSLGAKV